MRLLLWSRCRHVCGVGALLAILHVLEVYVLFVLSVVGLYIVSRAVCRVECGMRWAARKGVHKVWRLSVWNTQTHKCYARCRGCANLKAGNTV